MCTTQVLTTHGCVYTGQAAGKLILDCPPIWVTSVLFGGPFAASLRLLLQNGSVMEIGSKGRIYGELLRLLNVLGTGNHFISNVLRLGYGVCQSMKPLCCLFVLFDGQPISQRLSSQSASRSVIWSVSQPVSQSVSQSGHFVRQADRWDRPSQWSCFFCSHSARACLLRLAL